MISTPKRASCFATMIFSSTFMLAPGDCSPSRRVVSKILIMRVMVSPLFGSDCSKRASSKAAGEEDIAGVPSGVRRECVQAENEAGGRFQQSAKTQKPPSLRPGTEASAAPWYHPDLAMNNVRRPQPFIEPFYGGEAESITRGSWTLARRRV